MAMPGRNYHINAEHLILEIVDGRNRPVGPGQMGKVLITTLENRLMTLIRCEIGDYAVASQGVCHCGRTLPTIGRVIGRGINLFRLPDGKQTSPWPLVGPLREQPQLRQFQIVQKTPYRYLVRFVADKDLTAAAQQEIARGFSQILGDEVRVAFERCASIPRTAGAKFMTALCEMSG